MRYFMVLILLFSLFLSHSVQAKNLAKRGKYTLTQENFNHMIIAGQRVAKHSFTANEKKQLKRWIIDVYNKNPNPKGVQRAFGVYLSYIKLSNKKKNNKDQQLIWHHFYRKMVFDWRFLKYNPKHKTLMDVIQRYNPIIAKLPQQKLFLAKKDRVLVRKGQYFLSYPMWLAMQRTATFLSGRKISKKAASKLYRWSLADFKKTPKVTSGFYRDLLDRVIPVYYSPQKGVDRNQFRLDTYAQFYFSFQKDRFAKRWNGDLMDIVTRYHPLVSVNHKQKIITTRRGSSRAVRRMTPQEIRLHQQILMQTLQANQNAFNRMMRQSQRNSDLVNQSLRDFSTIQNIHISGDTVISSDDNYYLIEKPNGDRYEMTR